MHCTSDLEIRPATNGDAAAIARLWFMAFSRMFTKVFGEEAPAFLEEWLAQDVSLFACTSVACADGVPVGFMEIAKREEVRQGVWAAAREDLAHAWPLARLVRRRRGLPKVLPCLLRLAVAERQPIGDNELFITMLGVDTSCRGRGIGSRLLAYAEELARQSGRGCVALAVVSDNTGAKRLYERHGFTAGPEHRSRLLEWAADDPGYFKMVKELA